MAKRPVSLVYGLRLAVDPPVAWPSPSHLDEPDVELFLGREPPWLPARSNGAPWFVGEPITPSGRPVVEIDELASDHGFQFRFHDGTRFVVDRGARRVWAAWPTELSVEDTLTYLLGPVCGFILRRRGVLCVHGSAVNIDGQAVALVGPAGAGKSTTAAAFAQAGRSVLTDDVLVVSEGACGFQVVPGHDRLRLWPESVEALYGAPDRLPRITPTWSKRYLDLAAGMNRFQSGPLPLAAVYVLGERSRQDHAPLVEAIRGAERLVTLIGNMYAYPVFDRAMRQRELDMLGRVTARVLMRRVAPHEDVDRIQVLRRLIENDFRMHRPPPLE